MKYLDEYRDREAAQNYIRLIQKTVTRPWSIMEICGGQTHTIVKYGIDELLPESIRLIHGPGCPVCVTPVSIIDKAIEIASKPDMIFCSFGDMLRVPGSEQDLFSVKATGGDVRVVYSPLDAVQLARNHPTREVVFFAVGFETTAPPNAMAVYQAKREGLQNFSMLISHVLVPPAMEAILSAPDCRVQGFLAAGHVCTIMGTDEYVPIAEKYHVPIIITGFEPLDLLQGILMCVEQLEKGKATVENQYARSVRSEGNKTAQQIMHEVFQVVPRSWRGLGEIAKSGLGLRDEYTDFDAQHRFGLVEQQSGDNGTECISGLILQGTQKPCECPAFAKKCTPEHPLGAPMVSAEGACAAYYRYRRYHIDSRVQQNQNSSTTGSI